MSCCSSRKGRISSQSARTRSSSTSLQLVEATALSPVILDFFAAADRRPATLRASACGTKGTPQYSFTTCRTEGIPAVSIQHRSVNG